MDVSKSMNAFDISLDLSEQVNQFLKKKDETYKADQEKVDYLRNNLFRKIISK